MPTKWIWGLAQMQLAVARILYWYQFCSLQPQSPGFPNWGSFHQEHRFSLRFKFRPQAKGSKGRWQAGKPRFWPLVLGRLISNARSTVRAAASLFANFRLAVSIRVIASGFPANPTILCQTVGRSYPAARSSLLRLLAPSLQRFCADESSAAVGSGTMIGLCGGGHFGCCRCSSATDQQIGSGEFLDHFMNEWFTSPAALYLFVCRFDHFKICFARLVR